MGRLLTNYMVAFPYRFHFTSRDKRECFDTIANIIRIVYREKEIGRVNLEEEAYQTDNFFLKKALFLFVDKVAEATVSEILETYIVYGEYQSKELLEKMIIIDGISALFRNENPSIIEERLKAFVGEEMIDEYNAFKENHPAFTGQGKAAPKPASAPGPVTDEMLENVLAKPVFIPREKVETKPLNPNKVLSQAEIDRLFEEYWEENGGKTDGQR